MNKVQQKTGAAIRKCIIDVLERAAGDDETIDHIGEVCEEMEKIDTSAAGDEDLLMNDPKVKAAFKKFVSSTIGSFQQFESDRDEEDEISNQD